MTFLLFLENFVIFLPNLKANGTYSGLHSLSIILVTFLESQLTHYLPIFSMSSFFIEKTIVFK
jgi:hypothetical protein